MDFVTAFFVGVGVASFFWALHVRNLEHGFRKQWEREQEFIMKQSAAIRAKMIVNK